MKRREEKWSKGCRFTSFTWDDRDREKKGGRRENETQFYRGENKNK